MANPDDSNKIIVNYIDLWQKDIQKKVAKEQETLRHEKEEQEREEREALEREEKRREQLRNYEEWLDSLDLEPFVAAKMEEIKKEKWFPRIDDLGTSKRTKGLIRQENYGNGNYRYIGLAIKWQKPLYYGVLISEQNTITESLAPPDNYNQPATNPDLSHNRRLFFAYDFISDAYNIVYDVRKKFSEKLKKLNRNIIVSMQDSISGGLIYDQELLSAYQSGLNIELQNTIEEEYYDDTSPFGPPIEMIDPPF